MWWRGLFALATVILLGGAAAGCAPSAGSYCKKVCDCTGCDDAAEAACVDKVGDAQHRASKKDCGDKFNAYLACADSRGTCNGTAVEVAGCETEAADLTTCAGDIGLALGVSCESVCQRTVEECGGGTDCTQSCQQVKNLLEGTGCDDEYDAVTACSAAQPDICDVGSACNDEANVFFDCYSSYCSQNPGAPNCG